MGQRPCRPRQGAPTRPRGSIGLCGYGSPILAKRGVLSMRKANLARLLPVVPRASSSPHSDKASSYGTSNPKIGSSNPSERASWRRASFRENRSEAGVSSALRAIGRRTLHAKVRRRTVVIGEGAGRRAGPVIVTVADRVGQPVAVAVVVSARLRLAGDSHQGSKNGYGGEKLQSCHWAPPEENTNILGELGPPSRGKSPQNCGKTGPEGRFWPSLMLNEIQTQSGQSCALRSP
jgi:hypothetical protein